MKRQYKNRGSGNNCEKAGKERVDQIGEGRFKSRDTRMMGRKSKSR